MDVVCCKISEISFFISPRIPSNVEVEEKGLLVSTTSSFLLILMGRSVLFLIAGLYQSLVRAQNGLSLWLLEQTIGPCSEGEHQTLREYCATN